jgi:hypothetical protein
MKKVEDIVFEIPVWNGKIKIGSTVDYVEGGREQKVQTGQVCGLDLSCEQGLKYNIRKPHQKFNTVWLKDRNIIRVHPAKSVRVYPLKKGK